MKAAFALRSDVEYVCRHMRAESATEAFASVALEDRARLAEQILYASAGMTLLALAPDQGPPAALIGVGEIALGRGAILFLATEAFPSIMFPAHRWWVREFVPDVLSGYRRVEFVGSLPDSASGRWLGWCGFVCEGIARSYTKMGADLAHWAWINPAPGGAAVDAAREALKSGAPHAPENP